MRFQNKEYQLHFEDYEDWRNRNIKNDPFSMPDYIHGVFGYKSLHEDLCFAFLDFFWPEFIQVGKMVFIKDFYRSNKEKISDDFYKSNSEAEFWTNLLTLDHFLNLEDADKQSYLVNKIGEAWTAKLKQDFPKLDFKISVIDNEDDLGVSFQQV